jgi:hypothetical protein
MLGPMIILTRVEQLLAMIKVQEDKGLSAHPYVLRLREELREVRRAARTKGFVLPVVKPRSK